MRFSIFLLLIIFLSMSCSHSCFKTPEKNARISGQTMGTFYSVVIIAKNNDLPVNNKVLKLKIDARLEEINNTFSTYRENSTISKFNKKNNLEPMQVEPELVLVVKRAQEVFKFSDGAFNIAMDPLIDMWGFDKNGRREDAPKLPDITRVLAFCDPTKIITFYNNIQKLDKNLSINLSGIAKGFGVDEVARLLEINGYNNFMVEIGGEIVARGTNDHGKPWVIGIENPLAVGDVKNLIASVELNNMALATSGTYLNFFVEDGVEYSHIIDPRTGYPIKKDLVSVSIKAKDCMTADALATAAMVLGEQKMLEVLKLFPDASAMFVRKVDAEIKKSFAGKF